MKSFLQQSFRLSSDKAKVFIIFLLFSLLSSTLTAQNWDQIIKVAASVGTNDTLS